jgi:uncharacterized repeat protein (TIGR01451 family)
MSTPARLARHKLPRRARRRGRVPSRARVTVAALLALAGSLLVAGPASATAITSTGPLTSIDISPDLNCAVNHVGDSFGEWFSNTACATVVAIGTDTYGPAFIPAGSALTSSTGYHAYTPVGQSAVTGSGTEASPYSITTVVDLGTSGVRLTQTDSYVVGQEGYRTDVALSSTSGQAVDTVVYRAGDCYLQDSDEGLGDVQNGVAPLCKALPGSADPNRIEGFYPLTTGSHYLEARYSAVWAALATGDQLPDTCICATVDDNGAALSWPAAVPATGAIMISSLTVFSPAGAAPVTFTKTADVASVSAGAGDGYTVTMSNPGAVPLTLTSITDTLPAGFGYTADSTTGATTSDPAVSGQDLTWTGTFVVPAATAAGNGTLSLHFGVTVSSTAGTFTNSVTGSGDGVTVIGATDTAPVTVTAVEVNSPPTGHAGGPYSGTEGQSIAIAGAVTDADSDPLTYAWSVTASTADAGASCSFGDATAASTTITCTDDGTYDLSLEASDGTASPAFTTTLTVANAAPTVTITAPADMAQLALGSSVDVSATYADAGSNDTHTYDIDWGDGSAHSTGTATGGTVTGAHAYTAVGVHDITVTVTDDDGGVGSDTVSVVVADQATKVTGGGFVTDGGRTGFGFVAGPASAGGLAGQLSVHARGGVGFHGGTVTTMTSVGNTATWSGTGRWSTRGDGWSGGYTFTVSVADNGSGHGRQRTPDTIELTVWDGSGAVVLHAAGPLRGGNITVHR